MHTIQERAGLYNSSPEGIKYGDSRFMVTPRWVSATWLSGNNYRSLSTRSDKDKPYYGAYPPNFLKRIWPMIPDARRIMHLFSGSLTAESGMPPHEVDEVVRVDSRFEQNPSICCNAEDIASKVENGVFDVILADPPYSVADAENYGACLCNKKKVLDQCFKVLRPGGLLFWMDQAIPMYRKTEWAWVGTISMYRSTNHRIRGVMIFQKQ